MALSSGRQNMMMGLLVSLSVLLLAEAVARIAKTIDLDLASTTTLAAAEGFAYSSELGWERKPGFAGIAAGGHHREFDVAGYVASDSQQVADTTHTKVLFIGDSNTFGYGVSTNDVFVEVVEQRLPDIYAINLGVIGYTSYQGRMVFEKYASLLKPDLVVVSFNYNDRRAVLEPGSVDSADTFQRMYRTRSSIGATVSGILDASYFVRALRRVMRGAGLIVGVKVDPVDVWEPRVSEESYRLNLSQIATEAGRRGIPLVFLMLNDNPLESYHLHEGFQHLEGTGLGRSDALAIAHLSVAVESTNMFSDLARVYLAKAYRSQGNREKAGDVAISSSPFRSLQGGRPIRMDRTYNDIMRQVADQYGAVLVDAATVLNAHPDEYIDFCHFNEAGHRRVGGLLADRISLMRSTGTLRAAPVSHENRL